MQYGCHIPAGTVEDIIEGTLVVAGVTACGNSLVHSNAWSLKLQLSFYRKQL